MLEHWLIEVVGHVSGLSDAQLRQIEKSLPATKALLDLLSRARPIIEQAQSRMLKQNRRSMKPGRNGRRSACSANFGRRDFASSTG
jgi:hypothetical protein